MTDERGMVTATVVIFTVALLAVTGLVFDGGNVLAARRRAFNEAEAAARAGAQAVDVDVLRAGEGVVLDAEDARQHALSYLASIGRSGEVSVAGDVVRVRLALRQDLSILGAFGVGPLTVTGDAEARAVSGLFEGDD
ncbi:MAG: hypothetical protein HYU28_07660 [Actinobacteria bacterium]|nr:hypothetical protein [Actinomycetota bacterium]